MDTNYCLPDENPESNSKSELCDDDDGEGMESSFLQLRTIRVRSEDDILLHQSISPALLSLPSLLLERGLAISRRHGFTGNMTPLLKVRKRQTSTQALDVMHTVVANGTRW